MMSITSKIKSVLQISGKQQKDLAEHMNMVKQTLNNKMSRDSWSASDLIKVADLTGSKLAFVFPDGTQVNFSLDEAHETNRQIKKPEDN